MSVNAADTAPCSFALSPSLFGVSRLFILLDASNLKTSFRSFDDSHYCGLKFECVHSLKRIHMSH